MKDIYCSYEIAKLLKGKGFDERTVYHYTNSDVLQHNIVYNEYKNSEMLNACSAPSLQMTMAWLREIHGIYYDIQLLLGDKAEKYGALQLGVYQLKSSGAYKWECWLYSDTYEELYEKYIKYCLEHLI